jgi:hypothetical protein
MGSGISAHCWAGLTRSLCVAGALLALLVPVAKAEIQRPHEVITVVIPTAKGFTVYATLHPQKRVAVLGAQTSIEDLAAGTWSSTSYAKRVPSRSFGDAVHVDFGDLGRIDGRFVAEGKPHVGHLGRFCHGRRPISESGHFAGKFVFEGDGGYLDVSTRRAPIANIKRTFKLDCEKGHASHFRNRRSGLFGYAQASTDYLSNSDGTYLRSVRHAENLVTEFFALKHFRDPSVGFKAVAREWLPGDVATTRSIEVEQAPGQAFELAGPEERPNSAAVDPPLPFSGGAEYTSSLGSLSGDLAVSFLGKELSLAGTDSEAEICPRPDQDKLWDCPERP